MPSRSGRLVSAKISAVLVRKLTVQEILLCEQLALNFFTGPVLSYIERIGRKPLQHTFDVIYGAIANGTIRGAKRGARQYELRGMLLEAYHKLDLYHPDMSDGGMLCVVELADKYSAAEIDRGILFARRRGVQSVQYVLGCCRGNANKPTDRVKKPIELFEDDVVRPAPGDVADAWALAVKAAQDKLQTNDAERAANAGIEKR